MKRILLSLMLAFSLSGCMWQSINSHEIERARIFCERKGERIEYITESFVGDTKVTCSDREKSLV
jgi:hypothetical protein